MKRRPWRTDYVQRLRLRPEEIASIRERLANGEDPEVLARSFGVDPSEIALALEDPEELPVVDLVEVFADRSN